MILIILKNCSKAVIKLKLHLLLCKKRIIKQRFKKIKKLQYKKIVSFKKVYKSKRKEKQAKMLISNFKNINNSINS